MSKMNAPIFTLTEVAAAAGTKSSTLRQWIFRDWFRLADADAPAHTAGATTLVTGRTALAMGVAVHLGGGVVPLELAVKAACLFAYTGAEEGGTARLPGCLFDAPGIIDTLAVFSRGEGRNDWQTAILPKVAGMTLEDCIATGAYGITSTETLIVCPLASTVQALRIKLQINE